jgi:two-component system chemotaxis response regulator CheB
VLIRVLVVDDSVVIRRLVTQTLDKDPEIEVVGSASNGILALQKIEQTHPDVVTLDVEMPEMGGIETLKRIRMLHPKLFVIMFSSRTQRGAATTIDALAAGANDYVLKASTSKSVDESIAALRAELIPKIKQFFRQHHAPPPVTWKAPVPAPGIRATGKCEIVTIGISTGGPSALTQIIGLFPSDFPAPVLIVQHMPAMFTKQLAQRLATIAKLRVSEASEGTRVERGNVFIAPGDFHMSTFRSGKGVAIHLDQSPHENSCRPAADVLFRSAAKTYGSHVLAAVLTGMGQDGYLGCEAVKSAGGIVLAQDEATSVVWGMPGYVARAGLADKVLPLNAIVPEIIRRVVG